MITTCVLLAILSGVQARQASAVQRALAGYLSSDALSAYMQDYERRCRPIAKLHVIGSSTQGRSLLALELAASPGSEDGLPHFKYVGNLHGDEPTGRVLTLALAEYVCEAQRSDPSVVRMLGGMHLWLVPTLNPDGFDAKTRGNSNGRDMNRDFPDRFVNASMPPTGDEQPEVKALMEWSLRVGFTASAALHEGALVANYPWDGTASRQAGYEATPDDATFRHLASLYAEHHSIMSLPTNKAREGRRAGMLEFPRGGITNGAAWYPIYGSMQDWNYIVAGCFELTLELSERKWPSPALLPKLWEDNRESMLALPLAAVLGGVRGVVKGESSLRVGGISSPIQANITVVGIDTVVRTRRKSGTFSRPLAPGDYVIQAQAEGYTPATQNITVGSDDSGVELRFELQKVVGGSTVAGGWKGVLLPGGAAAGGGHTSVSAAGQAAALSRMTLLSGAGLFMCILWMGGWRWAMRRRGTDSPDPPPAKATGQ